MVVVFGGLPGFYLGFGGGAEAFCFVNSFLLIGFCVESVVHSCLGRVDLFYSFVGFYAFLQFRLEGGREIVFSAADSAGFAELAQPLRVLLPLLLLLWDLLLELGDFWIRILGVLVMRKVDSGRFANWVGEL